MRILGRNSWKPSHDGPMRLAILGCTGSIGMQTLDVCRRNPDKVRVVALSAYRSTAKLVEYAREFDVEHAVVCDESHANDPVLGELPKGCKLSVGCGAMTDLAMLDDVDCVVVAVVGSIGVCASYEALRAGKRLACANKEALVMGGDLIMPFASPGAMLPVDSEHSAIFQCLVGERHEEINSLWVTCSGGPFRGRTREQLRDVTVMDALAHPTWHMGPKITVDCATLMNKGLEVIEAHHLFNIPVDDIRVLVHPQSRIHSMVEFSDGTTKAQLGASDMRLPIQYSLSYPDRWDTPAKRVDFCSMADLTFEAPDTETFRCLNLAIDAGRQGGTMPCVLNAANEIANAGFRDGVCGFCDIDGIVETVMAEANRENVESLEQLLSVDEWARERARVRLSKVCR